MLKLSSRAKLVQTASDLSEIPLGSRMYMDFETTSGHDEIDSLNPWHFCEIAGIAITFDDDPFAYYIPLRHRGIQAYPNVDFYAVREWLEVALKTAKVWCNHNIKYDMHVLKNDLKLEFPGEIRCTYALASLMPREERFTYNLTDLSNEWLYHDISDFETTIKKYIKKDYGTCPADIMGEYACEDVHTVRKLDELYKKEIPEESKFLEGIEQRLTKILFEVEQRGMLLDRQKLLEDYIMLPSELLMMQKQLEKLVDIRDFRPHVNGDCYEYFVNRMQLPVVEWTDEDPRKANPSFGKDAIKQYKDRIPRDVYELMLSYKKLHKLYTGFTVPYFKMHNEFVLHCSYRQAVRTGRMACSKPNMQQLSKAAKEYMIARPGRLLVDFDYSQIEFRVIAHYLNDQRCIEAYRTNPKTDYHDWIANECSIARDPAKTMNFLLGYGGGKKRATAQLVKVVGIGEDTTAKAEAMYETYHRTLPNLKPTMREADRICKRRGYVRTLLGRRRYLPPEFSYKAFNTVCQGTAADFMKYATVANYEVMKSLDMQLEGIIHDSWKIDAPLDAPLDEMAKRLSEVPEGVNFRVPIVCNYKVSTTNWSSCK